MPLKNLGSTSYFRKNKVICLNCLNYISNRKQFVVNNSGISPTECMTCIVPQGSIVGPLLFILYTNDICQTFILLNAILFADDTTIFILMKTFLYYVIQ